MKPLCLLLLGLTLLLTVTLSSADQNFEIRKDGVLYVRILSPEEKWVPFEAGILNDSLQNNPDHQRAKQLRAEFNKIRKSFRSIANYRLVGNQIELKTLSGPFVPFDPSKANFLNEATNDREEDLRQEFQELRSIAKYNRNFMADRKGRIFLFSAVAGKWVRFDAGTARQSGFLAKPLNARQKELKAEFEELERHLAERRQRVSNGGRLKEVSEVQLQHPLEGALKLQAKGALAAQVGTTSPPAPCPPGTPAPHQPGGAANGPIDFPPFQAGFLALSGLRSQHPATQWGYPSDHIATGGTVSIGNEKLKVVTFNVMNEEFNQGKGKDNLKNQSLHRGLLGELDKNTEARHAAVFQVIFDSLVNGKAAVLALQEVSPSLSAKLRAAFKGTPWELRAANPHSLKDNSVIISDASQVKAGAQAQQILTKDGSLNAQTGPGQKYLHTVEFTTSSGAVFQFANAHVPKGQTGQLAARLGKPKLPTVVVGDMNEDAKTVSNAFGNSASQLRDKTAPYSHQTTQRDSQGVPIRATYDHLLGLGLRVDPDPALTQVLRSRFGTNDENLF